MRLMLLLKILGGFAVILVLVVIGFALLFEPNTYKDDIIAYVKADTGRDFSFGSDIDLKFRPAPSLNIKDVRLANADWGGEQEMLTLGELDIELALIPLVFGEMQVNRLILHNADILIESDNQGRSNLDFLQARAKENVSGSKTKPPRINGLVIEELTFTLIDGELGTTRKVHLKQVTAEAEYAGGPLDITVAGGTNIDGQNIDFDAEGLIGNPGLLIAGGEPYPIDLKVNVLGLQAIIKGQIADPEYLKGIDVSLDLAADNLKSLSPLAGLDLPDPGSVKLTTSVRGGPDKITLDTVSLTFGESDVRGTVIVDMQGERPRVTADLQADRFDLVALLPEPDESSDTSSSEQPVVTSNSSRQGKVFSTEPLPLDSLKALDVKLEFFAREYITASGALTDAKGVLALENGVLTVRPFEAKLDGHSVSLDMSVDASTGTAAVITLDMKGPDLDLGALLHQYTGLDYLRGTGAVDISLQGAGRSVAAIAGSLDGHTRVLMDEGQMKNKFLGNISGLGATIGEVFGKKEWIAVECIASDFEITKGIATSKVNLINTETLIIKADGNVNLGKETLGMKVTPQPKGIDLSLAVPVNIGGTFMAPSFTPDGIATLKKLGMLFGSVLFAPIAIAGMVDMGDSDNPCIELIQKGK